MTSKLDYLKKYMDDGAQKKGDEKRKKKSKKIKTLQNNIKIFDSQAEFKSKKNDEGDDHQFDLMEEKPMLYAEDGATIFTKEFEAKEKRKKTSWKTLDNTANGKNQRQDSSEDNSPLRDRSKSRKRHDSEASDISPPRKRRARHDSSASSDQSPQRQGKMQQSDSDYSPERNKRKGTDSDYSPERCNGRNSKKKTKQRKEEKPEVVSTGKKSGLQSAAELRKENERRKITELENFKSLDPEISGKGTQTIYRDRPSGKIIDVKLEQIKRRKEEEERAKGVEKNAAWGRGITQEKEHKQKLEDALHEISKPLARYKDDKDLDQLLKAQDRDGDPMAAYMAKKKTKGTRGVPSKPRYNGPTPAPNRFNIWPGYRYDGVDRSNGFEKKRFASINSMKTFNEAKHKWSVEDM